MDFNALQSSLEYVNRLLASHGFPSPLPLSFDDEETQESTVKIVNCVYALLQQRERDREWQSDAASRIKKLASENESTSSELDKTKSKLEQARRDVEAANARLNVAQKEKSDHSKVTSALKEELKQTKGSLAQTKSQCLVELRKKDKEIEKIKDRLAKASGSATSTGPASARGVRNAGLVCLNPLQRSVDHPVATSEHLYDILVTNHDEREREFTFENALLRRSLYGLYLDLRRLIDERGLTASQEVLEMDPDGNFALVDIAQQDDLDQVRMALPMEEVGAALDTKIKEMIMACHEKIEVAENEIANEAWVEKRDKWIHEHQAVVEKLNEQLEESQAIIAKQQEFLGGSLASAVAVNHRHDYEHEKMELEKERARLQQEAARLNQDRQRLQKDREEVEAGRRYAKATSLLNDAPDISDMPEIMPMSRKKVVAARLGSPSGPLSTGVALAQELREVSEDLPYTRSSPGAIVKTPKKTPTREAREVRETPEAPTEAIQDKPTRGLLPALPSSRYRPSFARK